MDSTQPTQPTPQQSHTSLALVVAAAGAGAGAPLASDAVAAVGLLGAGGGSAIEAPVVGPEVVAQVVVPAALGGVI